MTHLNPGRTISLLLSAFLLMGTQTFAADVAEVRSTAGFASERAIDARRDAATLRLFSGSKKSRQNAVGAPSRRDESRHEPSQPEGAVGAPSRRDQTKHAQGDKTGKQLAATKGYECCGFSVYSARTELFDDLDRDGFYTYLRLSLDIDTDYEEADLYIEVYMQGASGIWNHIYDSNVFTIFGNSGLDAYEVESELLSGYPTGYYDVLVEVYDAYTGELVIEYGPAEHDALSLLPMEEVLLDARTTLPPIALSSGHGGGSLSLLSLLLLASLIPLRHFRVPSPHRGEG